MDLFASFRIFFFGQYLTDIGWEIFRGAIFDGPLRQLPNFLFGRPLTDIGWEIFRGAIFDGLLRQLPNFFVWATFDGRWLGDNFLVERSQSTKWRSVQELPSLFITD